MKKGLSFTLATLLIVFYSVLIFYLLFAIVHADTLENCWAAVFFQVIGLAVLATAVLGVFLSKKIKNGYLIAIVFTTLMYSLILNVINLTLISSIQNAAFVFIHLALLFIYCLVSIPMLLVGKR